MKAFLLAGGRGERLRPLTLSVPKCLVPINDTPLLAIWLDLLGRQGITDVLVNVSHHVEQVEGFLAGRPDAPRVQLVVEESPLGNAGTVVANRGFVDDTADFWVFYADNLTNLRLTPMLETHARHNGLMTMGLFRAPDPRAAGIVCLDAAGCVVGFDEKPEHPQSDLANAGVYLARQGLFDAMPVVDGILDFGHHVLPGLVGRMYGHVIDDFLMDVGTPAALGRATNAWAGLGRRRTL